MLVLDCQTLDWGLWGLARTEDLFHEVLHLQSSIHPKKENVKVLKKCQVDLFLDMEKCVNYC